MSLPGSYSTSCRYSLWDFKENDAGFIGKSKNFWTVEKIFGPQLFVTIRIGCVYLPKLQVILMSLIIPPSKIPERITTKKKKYKPKSYIFSSNYKTLLFNSLSCSEGIARYTSKIQNNIEQGRYYLLKCDIPLRFW